MGSFKDPRLTAEEYLKYAAECEEMAETMGVHGYRENLLNLAKMWRDLVANSMPAADLSD